MSDRAMALFVIALASAFVISFNVARWLWPATQILPSTQ